MVLGPTKNQEDNNFSVPYELLGSGNYNYAIA